LLVVTGDCAEATNRAVRTLIVHGSRKCWDPSSTSCH
jgi:hypothetical protein